MTAGGSRWIAFASGVFATLSIGGFASGDVGFGLVFLLVAHGCFAAAGEVVK